jgi:flagellar biosynthesis protein FlhA
VEELIPVNLPLGTVQRVLQNLLKERVSIKDITAILDTLLDHSINVKDPEVLTEHVRQALSRSITRQYVDDRGKLLVFTLDPTFEKFMTQTDGGVSPDIINRLVKSIESVLSSEKIKGLQPVILCSSNVRRLLRRIVERISSSIAVLSSSEIIPTVNLEIKGMVKYEN